MPVIDIHTHGIAGYETRGATPRDILRIAEIHGAQGIDAIVPTIYPAPIDQMRNDIMAVKKAMEMRTTWKNRSMFHVQRSTLIDGKTKAKNQEPVVVPTENVESGTMNIEKSTGTDTSAAILGVYLEGPFLNPTRAGALDKISFLPAVRTYFEALVDGLLDVVKIITVAPELDGAPELIRLITDMGIIVSMGHSDATYNEAEAGFKAGAKGITHLFNAMRGIHHRELGIAGFGLTNPHVYIEVIADPFHLHYKSIELIFRIKELDKIIIVSDSTKHTRANDGGQANTDPIGTLTGGSMTIASAVQHLIGLGFKKDFIGQCVNRNPMAYLSSQP